MAIFTELLESRTFLSASALNTAVQIDLKQIHADLLKFRSDCIGCFVTLHTDIDAIKADDHTGAAVLKPLVDKFHADVKALSAQLLTERLDEKQNALADESVIVQEQIQILKDKGNAMAEKTDHAALLADRIKLQTDLVAGLNARLTTRQAAYTTIFNDGQAIVTAADNDTNANPKLVADLTKYTTDKDSCMTTVTGDITKLIADRTQLITDLTALENSPPVTT